MRKHTIKYHEDYVSVQKRMERGETIQTLTNGFEVKTLKSNPDKTVTLNGGFTMPIKDFHSLGGIVALYHEMVHCDSARDMHRIQTPFVPYR